MKAVAVLAEAATDTPTSWPDALIAIACIAAFAFIWWLILRD